MSLRKRKYEINKLDNDNEKTRSEAKKWINCISKSKFPSLINKLIQYTSEQTQKKIKILLRKI